jgi:hypothetical protein
MGKSAIDDGSDSSRKGHGPIPNKTNMKISVEVLWAVHCVQRRAPQAAARCAAAVPLLLQPRKRNFGSKKISSGFIRFRVRVAGSRRLVPSPGRGRRTRPPLSPPQLFLSEFNRIPVTCHDDDPQSSLRCVCVCVWNLWMCMCVSKACTPLSLLSAARLHQPASAPHVAALPCAAAATCWVRCDCPTTLLLQCTA